MPDAPHSSSFTASSAETIVVDQRIVACDGGGEPFGHPLVYLKIEDRDIRCSYCTRHFVLAAGAGRDAHH